MCFRGLRLSGTEFQGMCLKGLLLCLKGCLSWGSRVALAAQSHHSVPGPSSAARLGSALVALTSLLLPSAPGLGQTPLMFSQSREILAGGALFWVGSYLLET